MEDTRERRVGLMWQKVQGAKYRLKLRVQRLMEILEKLDRFLVFRALSLAKHGTYSCNPSRIV